MTPSPVPEIETARLIAVVVPEDIASWHVVEHVGFTFERAARYYDLHVGYYAITRAQFRPDRPVYRVGSPDRG